MEDGSGVRYLKGTSTIKTIEIPQANAARNSLDKKTPTKLCGVTTQSSADKSSSESHPATSASQCSSERQSSASQSSSESHLQSSASSHQARMPGSATLKSIGRSSGESRSARTQSTGQSSASADSNSGHGSRTHSASVTVQSSVEKKSSPATGQSNDEGNKGKTECTASAQSGGCHENDLSILSSSEEERDSVSVRFCSSHQSEVIKLFCESCQEFLCIECTVQMHHGHKYNVMGKASQKAKQNLHKLLEPAEKDVRRMEEALEGYCERRDEISAQMAEIEGQIHRMIDGLRSSLEMKRNELCQQLEELAHTKLTELNTNKSKLHRLKTLVHSDVEYIKSLISSVDEEELLRDASSCREMLKTKSAEVASAVLKPSQETNMVLLSEQEMAVQGIKGLASITTYQECAEKCHATGKGISEAVAGESSTAVVHVVDKSGNPCVCTCAIDSEITSELDGVKIKGRVQKKKGKYELTYTATIKGRHFLAVSINKRPIRGSPFQVTVRSTVKSLESPLHTIPHTNKPCGVATRANGDIFITSNHENCITVLKQNGDPIEEVGVGSFADVTVDEDGNVYAVNADSHQVMKFSPEGVNVGVVGRKGRGPLKFNYPTGIAFNHQNGKLYIANAYNHEIQVLNTDFTFYKSFGEKGDAKCEFNFPWNVCCNASGLTFVADSKNNRIQVFTAEGKFTRIFGQSGEGPGDLKRPIGIAVDADNYVYVSETGNGRVSVFTARGKFVKSFGEGLEKPRGIAVHSNSGVLYVCNYGQSNIQIY